MLTDQLEKIRFGGDEAPVRRLSVRGLLPDTEHYMTYEGSTTAPACHETVTWIVQNKPIYITKQQVRYMYIFCLHNFVHIIVVIISTTRGVVKI